MQGRCPHCGWDKNKINATHCFWCGGFLIEREENSLGILKARLEELKYDFWSWSADLGEFCLDRKIDLAVRRKIVKDFALWLDSIARQTVPLSEICNQKADKGNQTADYGDKVAGNREKFFRFPKKSEIWAFYAGIWAVLIGFWLLDKFIG